MYARVVELPQHAAARDWLDRRLNGRGRVGLPWPSLLTFLRIVTNPRIFERAERLPETSGQPDLVADAHLAALAIEHGLTLCSVDRDFARFPGLRRENPLGPRP